MCYPTPAVLAVQQAIPQGCPAKRLAPSQRLTIGLQAFAGQQTVTGLAENFEVSRKFVYQQAATAQVALEEAFAPAADAQDQVLFYLPVTKAWLQQVVLGLVFICHSSVRGVVEFLRDLLAVHLAVGTVQNYLHAAVDRARQHNLQQDLSGIAIAGLDEIFQQRRPVLVGVDVASTYCFLLSGEDYRDAEAWGVRLLELTARGFQPDATIADFAGGLRAGQELALPGVACRGDVFHALYEVSPVITYLENRAYAALTVFDKLQAKKTKTQRRQGESVQPLSRPITLAGQALSTALTLADDFALLARWLKQEVLAVSGLPYADRCVLFDFLVAELKSREELCLHRIRPVRVLLENQRDHLLAFAVQLERDLIALAADYHVAVDVVRELLDAQALPDLCQRRWRKLAALQEQLGQRFYGLSVAVQELADHVVRASSVVENLNSRLRSYFFLRRQLGADALVLLQFFLNHRRFQRSEHAERVGKSPAELLTGQDQPHWLELLGFKRFTRN